MAVNIVTGMTGNNHVTSDDERVRNLIIFGDGKYVIDYGTNLSADIRNNNLVRINDGMCINQGTQMGVELNDYMDCTVENGVSGYNRNDLIVMRYNKNGDNNIESGELVVIKGESTTETPTDPEYISGNILDGGDLVDDYPLYRLVIQSLTITEAVPLFTLFTSSVRKSLAGLNNVINELQYSASNPQTSVSGSSGSCTGNSATATSARGLQNTSAIGSTTNPVYFNSSGVPVAGTYTLGAACAKGVSTSVTSGDTNLVTGGAVSSAIKTSTNYEEGTFSPICKNGSATVNIDCADGNYKKIGNIVHFYASFLNSRIGSTISQITNITGLPFSAKSHNSGSCIFVKALVSTSINSSGTVYEKVRINSNTIDITLPAITDSTNTYVQILVEGTYEI